jgi:hypothetical protein
VWLTQPRHGEVGCRPKLGFTLLLQIDLQAYHVTRPAGMGGGGGKRWGGGGFTFLFYYFSKVGRQEHKNPERKS